MLEYSNIFFTSLFAVEMLLKMVAEGFFGYIKNGFNLFDSFIVVLRFDRFNIYLLCSAQNACDKVRRWAKF